MKGIRAFGNNQGGLNHTGDFELLFRPILLKLSEMAIFGAELNTSFLLSMDDLDEAERIEKRIDAELDSLALYDYEKNRDSYFSPGLFPKFAPLILDDWNELICFLPPFPDYSTVEDILNQRYEAEQNGRKSGDFTQYQKIYLDLDFALYFRNNDARYWECYAQDERDIDVIKNYMSNSEIEFEELIFKEDYPYGALKSPRQFKDVRSICIP